MAGLAGTVSTVALPPGMGRLGLPAVNDPEAGRIVPSSIAPTHAKLACEKGSFAGQARREGVSKISIARPTTVKISGMRNEVENGKWG
jgi:hypothetical protein